MYWWREPSRKTSQVPETCEVSASSHTPLHSRTWLLPGSVLLLLTWAWTVSLPYIPLPWWDEGWTLSVAENWVERGYYGLWRDGAPAPSGQAAAFPTVASVALGFRLLGVGLWQARLVQVFYLAGALLCLYALTRRLFDRRTAGMTAAALLLLSPHLEIHPLYMGRQVLAEPLMLFFLLAGLTAFLRTWSSTFCPASLGQTQTCRGVQLNAPTAHQIPLLAACLLWGVALVSKPQLLPFWGAALLSLAIASLFKRNRRGIALALTALAGSFLVSRALEWGVGLVLAGRSMLGPTTPGLVQVTAFLPTAPVRAQAFVILLVVGLPAVVGLAWGALNWVQRDREASLDATRAGRLFMLVLAGSWTLWYALFSVGWVRYLFPAAFLSSPFLASFLVSALDRARARPERRLWSLRLLLALGLVLTFTPLTASQLCCPGVPDRSAELTLDYLNTRTPSGALVETYDSELLFRLARRAHYPPDAILVQAIRRQFLQDTTPYPYDPLEANPDYLVRGRFGRVSELYDEIVARGAFRPVERIGDYEIYERMRP